MEKKEIREAIILTACIGVLVVVWVAAHRAPKGNVSAIMNENPNSGIILPTQIMKIGARAIASEAQGGGVKYTGSDSRDPLDNSAILKEVGEAAEKKEEAAVPSTEGLTLSAVIWGSRIPQAIINDKIVTVGEPVDGGKVVGIAKEGVRIDFQGREVLLAIK